jgi:hypothetical protein
LRAAVASEQLRNSNAYAAPGDMELAPDTGTAVAKRMLTTTLSAWLGPNMGAGSGLDRQPR